jgi:hypothetical protein
MARMMVAGVVVAAAWLALAAARPVPQRAAEDELVGPSIQSILELPTGWGARTRVRARG